MKLNTVLTSILLAVAVLLASCQSPPRTEFDRQPAGWKAGTGGINPGTSLHTRH